jgi:hypothetical protein
MAEYPALKSAIERGARAGLVVMSHLVMAVFMIGSIWGLERFIEFLWRDRQPEFFGVIPVNYLFQAMDVGVLGTFVAYGLIEAYRSLSSREDHLKPRKKLYRSFEKGD